MKWSVWDLKHTYLLYYLLLINSVFTINYCLCKYLCHIKTRHSFVCVLSTVNLSTHNITNNANTCTTRQFCPLADARLPPKSSVLWKLKTFIAKKFYQENGSMTDCCGRMVQCLYWYKKCWDIFLDVELKLNSL